MGRHFKQIILVCSSFVFALAAALSFSVPALAYSDGLISANPNAGSPLNIRYTTSTDASSATTSAGANYNSSTGIALNSYWDNSVSFTISWASNSIFSFPVSGYVYYDFNLTSQYYTTGNITAGSVATNLSTSSPMTISDGAGGSLSAFVCPYGTNKVRLYVSFNNFHSEQLATESVLCSVVSNIRSSCSYNSSLSESDIQVSKITSGYLNVSYASSTHSYFQSSTDYDLEHIIISAIDDGSEDLNTIVDLLTNIDVQTDLAWKELLNSNNYFTQLLALINSARSDNYSGSFFNQNLYLLDKILYGLSGATQGVDDLALTTYNRWKNIIKDALLEVTPTEAVTDLDNSNENLQNQLSSQEAIESQVYGEANSSIQKINWSVSPPSGIAGAAASLMALVGRFWDQLGILQFAVTITLLSGIVIALIGLVNRFSQRSNRSPKE